MDSRVDGRQCRQKNQHLPTKPHARITPLLSTGCCHPERSEGPLGSRKRSLATLGMTGGIAAGHPSLGQHATRKTVTIVIHNAVIATVDDKDSLHYGAAIAIDADRITAIGPSALFFNDPAATEK